MSSRLTMPIPSITFLAMTSVATAQTTMPPAAPAPTTIVVTGQRAVVVNKVDRKVYRTDADLQATTGSASDVLRNIPSVEVDTDGGISLRGDSSVTVLIDGKPASSLQGAARGDALLSLSAADIQQIEVITSPSAEFKADGSGGVINIVTKKNRRTGGAGQLKANMGNDGRYNLSASGSYNIGRLSLGGSLGVRRDDRRRDFKNETVSTDASGGVTSNALSNAVNESQLRGTAKASAQYAPNDNQTMGLTLDYATRHETQSSLEQVVQSGASTLAYNRYGHGAGPRNDVNAAFAFEQKLPREGEVLSFNLQSGQTDESNVYDYTRIYAVPATSTEQERDLSQEIYGVSELSVNYIRPFSSGSTLKIGYDVEYDRTAFNNTVLTGRDTPSLIINPVFENQFRYHQTVNAAYVTFDKTIHKLEILGGLRFEQTDISSAQKTSGDMAAQSYAKLYPTLNMTYKLSDENTLSAGISNRVQRVDPEDLNPYLNASDPNNLRQGNPDLKPEETAAYELGYRHDTGAQSYQLTGYYRKSRNGDTEVVTVVAPGVLLMTKENMPSTQSGGLEVITSGKLFAKLGYNLSGNAFYTEIDTQALGIPGTRSDTALNAKASLDYQRTPKDRWQISANYNGKRLTPQGYVMPVTTVNLGYRRQMTDTLAFVGTVSDLFNSQRPKRYFETPTFSGTYERRQYGQFVYVGLAYTFGASKKAKDTAFTYDQ
jgi:outer membrane receptor protein involved in Fe transport